MSWRPRGSAALFCFSAVLIRVSTHWRSQESKWRIVIVLLLPVHTPRTAGYWFFPLLPSSLAAMLSRPTDLAGCSPAGVTTNCIIISHFSIDQAGCGMMQQILKSRRRAVLMEELSRPTARASSSKPLTRHETPLPMCGVVQRAVVQGSCRVAYSIIRSQKGSRPLITRRRRAKARIYVGRPARHRLGAGRGWRIGGLARRLRPYSVGTRSRCRAFCGKFLWARGVTSKRAP